MAYASDEFRSLLKDMRDEKYRDFVVKLTPNIDPNSILGVRTPDIRSLAKKIAKQGGYSDFLKDLPHAYYEENNLHGMLIETMKDFDETIAALDAFLPYVDNWATCDIMSPKRLIKQPERLLEKICEWTKSEKCYTIRFGVEMLMTFFLDERFKPEYLDIVAAVKSEEYYVKMMVAWFFATALAKQYTATFPYIEEKRLDEWTHNKAIQKAIESLRITSEQKDILRGLKIKK